MRDDPLDRGRKQRREERDAAHERHQLRVRRRRVAVDRRQRDPQCEHDGRSEGRDHDQSDANAERGDQGGRAERSDREGERPQALEDAEHAGEHLVRRDPLQERGSRDPCDAAAGAGHREPSREPWRRRGPRRSPRPVR